MIKTILFVVALIAVPVLAPAEEPILERPRWSLEIKAGNFYPDIDNWETFYGNKKVTHYAGSLAYKILRTLEAGIEVGYIRDKGRGFAPQAGILAGNVTYEIAPVQAFILFRGVFSEEQWLVPYAGGGWTRIYYREKIENQGIARGSTDGYHGRAGIQLLLDGIDASAANSLYLEYGVEHTYVFVEAQSITAKIDDATGASVNLGGVSYLAGLLFEF
jgi:hypothetical protein